MDEMCQMSALVMEEGGRVCREPRWRAIQARLESGLLERCVYRRVQLSGAPENVRVRRTFQS